MTDVLIAVVGGVVTVSGGFFLTIRHFSSKQREAQNDFLDHLEKKNGHFERVTKEMSDTFSHSNERLTKELGKLGITLSNNNIVMNKVTDIILKNHNG